MYPHLKDQIKHIGAEYLAKLERNKNKNEEEYLPTHPRCRCNMTLEKFGVDPNEKESPWKSLGVFDLKTDAIECIAEENSRSRIEDNIPLMGTTEELPNGKYNALVRVVPPGWSSTQERIEREKRQKRRK